MGGLGRGCFAVEAALTVTSDQATARSCCCGYSDAGATYWSARCCLEG